MSFTGTDSDGNLTLSLGLGATFGTLSGQTLTLQEQQSNGGLSMVTFQRSSVAAYNQYVAHWSAAIRRANEAAAAALAAAAAAAQHKGQLQASINQTAEAVDSELYRVTYYASYIAGSETDLANVVSDVAEGVDGVKDDILTYVPAEGCFGVSYVYSDAAAVAGDANSLLLVAEDRNQGDQGIGVYMEDVLQAVARLAGPYSAYWQAQHALPNYHPTPPIPPLRVAQARGQSIVNRALARVNSDIDQENGYVAQVYKLVNAANEANHCGPPKSAPVIGHVTTAMLGG